LADALVAQVDKALRTLTGAAASVRENPAADVPEGEMSPGEREHAAGLMRVNHTGEICAQALYEGQALTASDPRTRTALLAAASEESDHLAWCAGRLAELGSSPSVLNPAFYALSYALGAVTGVLGDKVSLGFVEATEDPVCRHLESHLQSLPAGDSRSRQIVRAMREDEARHGAEALGAGGAEFPQPVKRAMSLASRLMTETTYRV
jgi:ubiquinone biosynthesis monooxygenase Coq7